MLLAGCAVVPAAPMGSSKSEFKTKSDIPVYISIAAHSRRAESEAIIQSLLQIELPKLGFVISNEKAEAEFDGHLDWSGDNLLRSNDASFTLELRDLSTNKTIWRTRLSQRGDVYQRPGEAAGILVRRALELLERDINKATGKR